MESTESSLVKESFEKPLFLYHGSPHKSIKELEPRRKYFRDPKEGPKIFATQELSLATCFLLEGITSSGLFGDTPYAVIIGDREEIIKNDKGGHIYVLPSDKFESDPHKGLREYEWTTDQRVEPIKTIEYKSAVDAMIKNGVQVYFVDKATHQKIRNSKDHGFSILNDMESENMHRDVNVRHLSSH